MSIHLSQLGKFIKNNISTAKSVLEVVPWHRPLAHYFFDKKNIFYIDKEVESNELKKIDFINFESNINYNVIFDSLCMHEQPKESWHKYLDKVYRLLTPNGSFICRHAVSTSETSLKKIIYCLLNQRKLY